jgi:hypothetical protein
MGSPARRRANRLAEQTQDNAGALPADPPNDSHQGDGGSHASADAVATEREKPRGP